VIPSRGIAAFAVLALVAAPVAARDLARGHPCRFSLAPNYAHCTDPNDAWQLTDGERARGVYAWLDRRSVGWELERGDVVAVVVDLGERCRLDSVRISTFEFAPAGVAPPALVCSVSEGDSLFERAGAVQASGAGTGSGALRPTPEKTRGGRPGLPSPQSPRRLEVGVPLQGVRGRIVMVAALLQAPYFIIDEIEVHGSADEVPVRGTGEPARGEDLHATRTGAGAMESDLAGATRFGVRDLPSLAAAQRRLWAVRAALPDVPARLFPALSVRGEEAARLAARARTWRAAGRPAVVVRRVDPWAPTTPWSAPQGTLEDTLQLAEGGNGAAAFEIACAADAPRQVRVTLPPGAAGAPRATLREVVQVESRDGDWAGDALPLLRGALAVQPGQVRQVWVDLDARQAATGLHRIHILAGDTSLVVPVRVHAVRLPQPPIGALDFTYPAKRALTSGCLEAAVRDNVEHGIDTWLLPEEAVPWPGPEGVGSDGHLARGPDFAACDAALAEHPWREARLLGWFWNLTPVRDDPTRGRLRHAYGSRAWRRAASEWLSAWVAHLHAQGLDLARTFMMPFDETAGRRVGELFRFLKQREPRLRLALTLTSEQTPAEIAAVLPWLDIAILARNTLDARADLLHRLHARGAAVWTYAVPEPSKTASPLASYRLLPWEAWARGLDGCAFWAYADCGDQAGDAWDDFDGTRMDYAAVYGAAGAPAPLSEPITPSKRWQAFRIGLQDVAILHAAEPRLPGLADRVRVALASPSTRRVEQLVGRALDALE